MKLLPILLVGLGVLAGAIVLNFFAAKIGAMTWYTFVQNPSAASVADYVWLFIVYPFGLGLLAVYLTRWLA